MKKLPSIEETSDNQITVSATFPEANGTMYHSLVITKQTDSSEMIGTDQ